MTSPLTAAPAPDPKTPADLVKQGETGSAYASGWGWDYGSSGEMTVSGDYLPTGPSEAQMLAMIERGDGKIAELAQALTLPLRQARTTLVAPAGDQGVTEWVTDQLYRPSNAGGMTVPLGQVIAQMTAATYLRRRYFEKVWRPTPDGRVGYAKLAVRPNPTCVLKRDPKSGAYRGFAQTVPKIEDGKARGTETVVFAPARSFVYIHGSHRDPLWGVGDLDYAYLCADTKRKIKFLWTRFLEDVAFPSGLLSTEYRPEEGAKLQAAGARAASLRGGGILPLAKGESLAAYTGSSSPASAQFMACLDWLSSDQASSVLAGFTNLNSLSKVGGSYALSRDGSDLFTGGRDAVGQEMGEQLTSYVVADLVRWNFGGQAPVPRLVFEPLGRQDMEQILTLLQDVAGQQPGGPIPAEFADALVLRVAAYLDLGVDKIRQAIESRVPAEAPPVVQTASRVNSALRLVTGGATARAAAQA